MIMENRTTISVGALRGGPEPKSAPQQRSTPLTFARIQQMEEEISRLSWAVMDGWATSEDRQKLAELVAEQYQHAASGQ